MSEQAKTPPKLLEIRNRKDLKLKKSKYLKETYIDLAGKERPLQLRYYQVQGVLHLVAMKRFLLGDDTGTGKTLQVIAALCHVWEKEPDKKVIILTTKSSVNQWADEFEKFTVGIKVVICKGTAGQRNSARKIFETSIGPTVLVSGYRSMVQDFSKVQKWQDQVLVTDECFQYHMPILLADGTTELIGKIVTKKTPVEVISWNTETKKIETKKVIDWYRKPIVSDLLHLSFRFSGDLRVTKTHKFYTTSGSEVEASKLKIGSEIYHYSKSTPSEDQWQVILGALLGDSSLISPNRPRWGVAFGHSEKQEPYLRFKHNLLSSLGTSDIEEIVNSGYPLKSGMPKPYFRFYLSAHSALTSFLVQARIRQEGKKKVTFEWLDRINPLGLAIWYADDGSLNEYCCVDGTKTWKITLNTQNFTKDEVEFIAGWLYWKWGVRALVKTTKARKDREEGCKEIYPYLYLGTEASQKFLNLLPCGFPGVEYKFPGKTIATLETFDKVPQQTLVVDWVTDKSNWKPADEKEKYVYNLEVADNHNYFANGSLVSNCTAYKNSATQVHQVCRHLAEQADRVWALSATLIKNNLMEGFGIYQVINSNIFAMDNGSPMSKNQFMLYYCLTRQQPIHGGRYVTVITGYAPQKIREFKDLIDPWYIGRPKHEVATELPTLTCKTIEVELSEEQEDKYQQALGEFLEVGRGSNVTVKEVTKLTAIAYCQEIVNHLELIDCEGESPKLDTLIDLLTEGDFSDEKVIVFTRFEKLVTLIMKRLEKEKIKAVRVTGKEKEDARKAAMQAFQDPKNETRVICITTAGSESINLQAAKALVCFDTPWSAGDFLQLIGRMIRIGSPHDKCYVLHLLGKSKKKNGKTIDHRVMEVLGKKMALVEAVLGKRIKGDQDSDAIIPVENDISDLFSTLQQDARENV
jgi:superfamily II DNA or RNA helicase